MKPLLVILSFATLISSCSSGDNKNGHDNHDTAARNETAEPQAADIISLKPTFSILDKQVSNHISIIFDHYTQVQKALVSSNATEARAGANAMVESIEGFDKSLLTAEQKQAYDKAIYNLRKSAGGISSSSDLTIQRAHFSTLSNNAYELARSFGAGRTIYHDHCPMAFENKGAMWLSEDKEIKNPYFGEKMLNCGTVEEVIQN